MSVVAKKEQMLNKSAIQTKFLRYDSNGRNACMRGRLLPTVTRTYHIYIYIDPQIYSNTCDN